MTTAAAIAPATSMPNLQRVIDHGDPEPLCAVDAWAWAHFNRLRVLGGQYTTVGHEYQVDILQCDHPYQVAKKATQMGFTEVLVIKALHALRYGEVPQGILYTFPTQDEVSIFSKSRFKPFLKNNPDTIGKYVRDTDSTEVKAIGKAFLHFRGMRLQDIGQEGSKQKSSSKLKSTPVDAVYFDELDEMDQDAIPLALARMEHSNLKWEWKLANPTIPDWGIDREYSKSDQRVWMIECQSCGYETCLELEFPNCLVRRKDGSVYRACKHCGKEIHPRYGFWVPQYPSKSKDMVGWWISHLCSSYADMTKILNRFEDPRTDLVKFYNLDLGMAYIAAEDRLTANDVWATCGHDVMAMSHAGPCAAGVDVGKDLHVLIGQRQTTGTIKIVKMVRVSTFEDVWDLTTKFGVRSIVFDQNPEQHKVREFCAAFSGPAFGCQYSEYQKGKASWDEKSSVITVNRTEVCDASHKIVTMPGGLEIPRKDDEVKEFVTEMVNVAKVLEEKKDTGEKIYRYRKLGADHYRHALNYLMLAAMRMPKVVPRVGTVVPVEEEGYYF